MSARQTDKAAVIDENVAATYYLLHREAGYYRLDS